MLGGNINRQTGRNSDRFGARLITTNRIVAEEGQFCHATAQAQLINVDQAGTLPQAADVCAGVQAVPGTTCFTQLSAALAKVNNQLGGTIINLAAGNYTLPDVDLAVDSLKIVGDTCPVVGVSYIHGARRNALAETFIPDNVLAIQGSGKTTLTINGQTIVVSMTGNNPDFTQCSSLVGHSVKIHATNGGTGAGTVTTHTITGVTANTITISGVMPLAAPLNNGDGFVIVPNVTLSAADGTVVKSVQQLGFEGVVFDVSGTLYVHGDEQNYVNTLLETDSTLFLGGKSAIGTGNTVLGHVVSGAGTQQLWSWGGILGPATVLADANSFAWQFGVAAGGGLPFLAQSGAQASLFGSDFFANTVGAQANTGSTISIANAWGDANDTAFLADTNSTLSAEGLNPILGFTTIPVSVTNNVIGIAATYSSHMWAAGSGSLPIAALDLPAIAGNGTDIDLDNGAVTSSFPTATPHLYGDLTPAAGASGFSHVFAPA